MGEPQQPAVRNALDRGRKRPACSQSERQRHYASPRIHPALAEACLSLAADAPARSAIGTVSATPRRVPAQRWPADVLRDLGRFAEVVQALEKAQMLQPGLVESGAGRTCFSCAKWVLAFAEVGSCGHVEGVLKEALTRRDILYMRLDPRLDLLRDTPEFRALPKGLGL